MKKRKPAKTINEFVNNLFLGALTQEQADFYVPFYDGQIAEIRDSLIYDQLNHQTIYLMGQVGTGKTTALIFCQTKRYMKNSTLFPYMRRIYSIWLI